MFDLVVRLPRAGVVPTTGLPPLDVNALTVGHSRDLKIARDSFSHVIRYSLFELVIKQITNKAKLVPAGGQCWQKLLANAQNEEEAEEQSAALCEKSSNNFSLGQNCEANINSSYIFISMYI